MGGGARPRPRCVVAPGRRGSRSRCLSSPPHWSALPSGPARESQGQPRTETGFFKKQACPQKVKADAGGRVRGRRTCPAPRVARPSSRRAGRQQSPVLRAVPGRVPQVRPRPGHSLRSPSPVRGSLPVWVGSQAGTERWGGGCPAGSGHVVTHRSHGTPDAREWCFADPGRSRETSTSAR